MTFFERLFGKKGGNDSRQAITAPWASHPSVYEHVKAHIKPAQNRLADGGDALPDEERVAARAKLRWVPGGRDGAFGHHGGGGKSEQEATDALSLLRRYCKAPSLENKVKLYNWFPEHSVIDFVDPLLKSLRSESGLNLNRLHDLARSLATESPDREPVKIGIAILGMFSGHPDKEVFQTLGRHEEFTLYCAVALANTSQQPEEDLWELAKGVNGWGRIHVVERIAETQNPQIKDWLLREGYSNSVMNEYLAYTCAKNGNLRAAIDKDRIDDGLLASAGELIDALIAGGPAENMDDYDDGAAVVEDYLRHLAPRASMTKQFLTMHGIQHWLSEKDADWKAREAKGWTPDRRMQLAKACEEVLSRPMWTERVLAGLQSDDETAFFNAVRAADVLGIDTWVVHWDRLRKSPLTSGRWFPVMKACSEQRISDVTKLAEESLPLDKIATGPASKVGLGKQYEANNCLDYILQELGRFPGQGTALVRAGLRSPVISNRNMALRALAGWGKSNWPEGMEQLLREALPREPETQVREWIQKVLDGKALD